MKFKAPLPRLIHFFGPDGSGKSTQADILANLLDKRGVRTKKCWIRANHTVAFVLGRILIGIGFSRVVLNQFGFARKLPAVHRNRPLGCFWSAIELLGVIPLVLRVYFLLNRGYRLVAERYVLDTVTSIAYFINDINFLRSATSRVFFRFIPKNTAFIFLDSDYEAIFGRRAPASDEKNGESQKAQKIVGSITKSSVEPREFIEFQRVAYKALAKSFNALAIDTSKLSVEKTSELILHYLGVQ